MAGGRKKGEPRDKPVSLHPLAFEEALEGLLQVQPEKDTAAEDKKAEPEGEEHPD